MQPTLIAAAVVAAVALPAAAALPAPAAKTPVRISVLSLPPAHPVAGSPWRFAVRVRSGKRPYAGPPPLLRGHGDTSLRVRTSRTRRAGVFAATVRFPASGPWRLEVVVGNRTFPLGSFAVDVPVTEQIQDPFTIAALPDGSLLIGQRNGPLLRAAEDRTVSVFAPIENVTTVALSGDGTVLVSQGTRVHRLRLDGSAGGPPLNLSAEAVVAGDAAGNVYAAYYENRVVQIEPSGESVAFAGTGEAGYSGDGGPATAARLLHPHDVAVEPPGRDVLIADTGNGRIRRVNRSTGLISTVTSNAGAPLAIAFGPDGALYSVGLAYGNAPPGVWQTTAAGSTVIAQGVTHDITVGRDGTIYVTQWDEKRISRIDRSTGLIRTILRGR